MRSLPVDDKVFIKLSTGSEGQVVTLAKRRVQLAPPANKVNRGLRLNLTLQCPNRKPILLDVLNCKWSKNPVMFWWKEYENGRRQPKRDVVKQLYALGFSVEQAYALLYDPEAPGFRPLNSAISRRALHIGVATWPKPTWHSKEIVVFTIGDDDAVRVVDSVGVNKDGKPFFYPEAPFISVWGNRHGHPGELTLDAVRHVFNDLCFNPSIVDYAFGQQTD